MANIGAVLFDVDGTLLDGREGWVRAFNAGLAAAGRPPLSSAAAGELIQLGGPVEIIYEERCGLGGDYLRSAFRAFLEDEARSARENPKTYPGIPQALANLSPRKLGAITNKPHGAAIDALRMAGLLEFFELVLGGDSVPRKKPAPDPVLQAARSLRVSPPNCAVVGDTEADVRSAKAAGALAVGVAWGYSPPDRLRGAGADLLVETPEDLPRRLGNDR